MKCVKCGKEMFTSFSNGDNVCQACKNTYGNYHINIPNNCDMPLPQGFGEQKGWICPVCGRGVAPWMDFCPCRADAKITYGTAISVTNDGALYTKTNVDSEWNKYSTYTDGKL